MTNQRQINARITNAQAAALKAARAVSGDPKAQAIRTGLRLYCEQHSVEWPEDMPQWGGDRYAEKGEE